MRRAVLNVSDRKSITCCATTPFGSDGEAVSPSSSSTATELASRYPVAGSPFDACHSRMALRVRGPNSPSGEPESNPNARSPIWIRLRWARSRCNDTSASSADSTAVWTGCVATAGNESAISTTSVSHARKGMHSSLASAWVRVLAGSALPHARPPGFLVRRLIPCLFMGRAPVQSSG